MKFMNFVRKINAWKFFKKKTFFDFGTKHIIGTILQ